MNHIPKAQEIYRHFKGNLYQVVAIANHSETGEELVVYQALYGDFRFYARPLAMFMGKVDKVKYPNAAQEYRFERIAVAGEISEESDAEESDDRSKEETQEPSEVISVPQDIMLGEKIEILPEDSAVMEEMSAEPEMDSKEPELDPLLEEFLDATTYEERLNILTGLHHKITEDMLTTMAVVCDIELKEGSVEEKYGELKNCLLTLERFECNRLR